MPLDAVEPEIAKVCVPQFLNVVKLYGSRSDALREVSVVNVPDFNLHDWAGFSVNNRCHFIKNAGQVNTPCRPWSWLRVGYCRLHWE